MVSIPKECDVIVVGTGNAALTAAISARESGARVVVVEKAPEARGGGNSRFTGGIYRFWHDGEKDLQLLMPDLTSEEIRALGIKPYSRDQFYNDLMRVTEGLADPELGEILVDESLPTVKWINGLGFKWDLLGRAAGREIMELLVLYGGGVTPLAAQEGGQGVVRMLKAAALERGVDVFYEVKATRLIVNRMGRVTGLTVQTQDGLADIQSRAVILACGSFEANAEMRTKYMGPQWNLVRVRGTRYNTGEMLRACLDIGAQPTGHWAGQHASALNAYAGQVEDGEAVAYSFNYCITVNRDGRRFIDEGEDVPWMIYAKMGREILAQPGALAYQIFDAKVESLLLPTYQPATPAVSETIEGLADQLGMEPAALEADVDRFNEAVTDAPFNRFALDGKAALGLRPPKSNWAQRIDTPPFKAYPVVCGITFAFGGVKTNGLGQVIDTEDRVIPGLYAVGEMQGGLFYHNYPGASGLMKGAIWGRISGACAAGGG